MTANEIIILEAIEMVKGRATARLDKVRAVTGLEKDEEDKALKMLKNKRMIRLGMGNPGKIARKEDLLEMNGIVYCHVLCIDKD